MSERTIGPGTAERAVVVLSTRLGVVLPAAAVPLLRAGAALRADPELPDALREQFGAGEPGEPGEDGLLLTLDASTGEPARWLLAGADVLRTPEPAGSVLLDAVAVMDRLRSPGGCPWDAEQTHASLMPYLIEETYELYQALEDGDRVALREELGDVLLQVLFHARLAAEAPDGFDVDAVATELVAKLVARHPHVFPPKGIDPETIDPETIDPGAIDPGAIDTAERVVTASDQEVRWEELKRAEKHRESCVDGVALGQPAAALAGELVSRTAKAGLPSDLLPAGPVPGAALFALAARAKLAGADPEAALRTVARQFGDDVRAAEGSARAAGLDPAGLDPAGLTPEQWRAHWPARDRGLGASR